MKQGSKTVWIVLAVIAVLIVAVIGWSFSTYNSLVSMDESVQKYRSDISADLQRRNDLIPNLVETVKGYAAHEEGIFTEIADARSRLVGAGTTEEMAQADAAMSSALSRLLAITESYPELKADQNFINLQTQLEGTENRIKVARTKYNDAAREYNTRLRRFPASMIAGMFHFEKAEYFEAAPGAEEVPQVSFGS